MAEEGRRIIGFIDEGVVIDHLPQGAAFKVAQILDVEKGGKGRVTLGDGYESKKIGRKSLIKIEGRGLSEYELNVIALVAPNASISFIKRGKVLDKRKADIPEKLENLVYCANPNCITNDAGEKLQSLIYYNNGIFKCHYCEHSFSREEARLNIR